MEATSNFTDSLGANCSLSVELDGSLSMLNGSSSSSSSISNESECDFDPTQEAVNNINVMPSELTEISTFSLVCVIAYCIVFVLAAGGNSVALKSLWRQYKITGSRISLLLLNLSLADLIVCCTLIPTEVFWRLTIAWRGGNLLCKLTQFLRAFGLYLSSLVLICVSLDRFLAIIFPLSVLKAEAFQKVKVKLAVAWILATVFSIPQAIFFEIQTHPQFPSFTQCVTAEFLNKSSDVHVYSIFSVVVMYFVPLLVILFTYTAIIIKLVRKSSQKFRYAVQVSSVDLSSQSNQNLKEKTNDSKHFCQLRCSGNAEVAISKAKRRTFQMTVFYVVIFIFCWTPYSTMTLWYMIDWDGAKEVDPRVQDSLFLMAVANSCINPLIHGSFTYKGRNTKRSKQACWYCCCCCN